MKKNIGFTIIEILIVLSILIIIFIVALPTLNNFKDKQALSNSAENTVALLNDARSKTLAGEGGNNFSVYFEGTKATLSAGSTYVPGGPYFKEVVFENGVILSASNIVLNGTTDTIVFTKLTGNTTNYGTITLALISDPTKTKVITILKTGIVNSN